MRRWILALAALVVSPQLERPCFAQVPPADFVVENPFPTATFDLPVEIAFLPDGRRLVAEDAGMVWMVLANGTKSFPAFLDLRLEVALYSDLGLLGLAIDPDFATNRWVYLAYAVDPNGDGVEDDEERFGRVTRYRASVGNPNVADLSTRQVLVGATWPEGMVVTHTTHTVGAIRFGEDKSLLVSVGEGAHYDEIDDGGMDFNAFTPGSPCKGIVAVKSRQLSDVRRPDYETIAGFGANLLNDDLEIVTACHDACNRYGLDAVSASATLAWACEAVEEGILSRAELDGVDLRWGNGEAALELTIKMGRGEGCGAWLRHGSARAARHLGRGSERFAVHVHGQEPAYHDPRFTSLMGVTYISDPTPGRHTAGSASWNETFNAKFPLPEAADAKQTTVAWRGTEGKGKAQALYSNAHQVMNGLGLCMFTNLTGGLPWLELVNSLTGWSMTEKDLLLAGERIQNLRAAFNRREGIAPADFAPHPRMLGEGDGNLQSGPLKGIKVPLETLKTDYYRAMHWNPRTGHLSRQHAEALGLTQLLDGYLDA
jgi:hypothetical protein